MRVNRVGPSARLLVATVSLLLPSCRPEAPVLTGKDYEEVFRQVMLGLPASATLYVDLASFLEGPLPVTESLSEDDLRSSLPTNAVVVRRGRASTCVNDPPSPECPLSSDVLDRIVALDTIQFVGSTIEVRLLMVDSHGLFGRYCVGDITYSFGRVEEGWTTEGGSYTVC